MTHPSSNQEKLTTWLCTLGIVAVAAPVIIGAPLFAIPGVILLGGTLVYALAIHLRRRYPR